MTWTKDDEIALLLQLEQWVRSRLERGGAHAEIVMGPLRAYLTRLDRVRAHLAASQAGVSTSGEEK